MSYHKYYCSSCNTYAELLIKPVETDRKGYVDDSKGYSCSYSYLASSLTEDQIKDLKDWEDPRDFEKYETIDFTTSGEIPLSVDCIFCDSGKLEKTISEIQGWVKGICFTNKERERKFYEKGMDKQQATEFYKQSMEASKERIQSGGVHYKQVVPDMNHMRKTGQAKKVSDKKKKERVDNIAKMNQHIHKAAGIDPLKKP